MRGIKERSEMELGVLMEGQPSLAWEELDSLLVLHDWSFFSLEIVAGPDWCGSVGWTSSRI